MTTPFKLALKSLNWPRLYIESGHYCKIDFYFPISAVIIQERLIEKVRLIVVWVRYICMSNFFLLQASNLVHFVRFLKTYLTTQKLNIIHGCPLFSNCGLTFELLMTRKMPALWNEQILIGHTAGWGRNHPKTNTEKIIPTTFAAILTSLGSNEFRRSQKSWCYGSYLGVRGQRLQGSK